jgi:hypothetical protein
MCKNVPKVVFSRRRTLIGTMKYQWTIVLSIRKMDITELSWSVRWNILLSKWQDNYFIVPIFEWSTASHKSQIKYNTIFPYSKQIPYLVKQIHRKPNCFYHSSLFPSLLHTMSVGYTVNYFRVSLIVFALVCFVWVISMPGEKKRDIRSGKYILSYLLHFRYQYSFDHVI